MKINRNRSDRARPSVFLLTWKCSDPNVPFYLFRLGVVASSSSSSSAARGTISYFKIPIQHKYPSKQRRRARQFQQQFRVQTRGDGRTMRRLRKKCKRERAGEVKGKTGQNKKWRVNLGENEIREERRKEKRKEFY